MTDRYHPGRDPWHNTIDMLNPDEWQFAPLDPMVRQVLMSKTYDVRCAGALLYGVTFPRIDEDGAILLVLTLPGLAGILADQILYGEIR